MDQLEPLLRDHAYSLIFLLGLAEYAGVPVAATPVLLTVGAMTVTGRVSFVGALVSIVLGGLLGDLLWYSLLRWRGHRVVRFACGLSSNPNVCAVRAAAAVSTGGTARLVLAKFVPGLGAVTAAASGLAKVPVMRFVVVDVGALGLWAMAYLLVGRMFSGQLASLLRFVATHAREALVLVAALGGAAVIKRARKMWLHRAAHQTQRGNPAFAELPQ